MSNIGGSQPHTNMMPYLNITFMIALQGAFPSAELVEKTYSGRARANAEAVITEPKNRDPEHGHRVAPIAPQRRIGAGRHRCGRDRGRAKIGGADAFAKLLNPGEGGRTGVWLAKAASADWVLQVGSTFTARYRARAQAGQRPGAFPRAASCPRACATGRFVARFDILKGGKMPGDKIYRVNHKQGAFDLFLTTGDPSKPLRMKAVFS